METNYLKKQEVIPRRANNGKIVIELDPKILEDVVFTVLKSEKGQEVIRSIPKKRIKQVSLKWMIISKNDKN